MDQSNLISLHFLFSMNHLSGSEKTALKQLTDVIRWHAPADLYRLYLFGSRATGKAKPNSDYDIAIE